MRIPSSDRNGPTVAGPRMATTTVSGLYIVCTGSRHKVAEERILWSDYTEKRLDSAKLISVAKYLSKVLEVLLTIYSPDAVIMALQYGPFYSFLAGPDVWRLSLPATISYRFRPNTCPLIERIPCLTATLP